DMHADAEADLLFFCERVLNRDRALDGINGTGKIRDYTVAGTAENPPAMGCDTLVENGAAGGQPAQGADLVLFHQPAVACDISGEDRCELADCFLSAHSADKADAFAVRGTKEALLLAAVADCAARRIYPRGQGRFRDDPSVPHGSQQIVLADDALAIADH